MHSTLISGFLPADHQDSCHRPADTSVPLSPEEILKIMFTGYPAWVKGLFKIRDWIVKPFGLETGQIDIVQLIIAQNEREIVIGQDDKHLQFYVSVEAGAHQHNRQDIRVTTLVKYHNALGRVYFFFIRPFHHIIVRTILKRALRTIEKQRQLSK